MAFLIIAVRAFGGSLAWGTAIAAPLAGGPRYKACIIIRDDTHYFGDHHIPCT
jgi:hypothetical protein